MITMENVCKSYRIAKRNAGFTEACKALFHREYEEIHALRNVSFTISDGEMVGYIGPNGAGKSSTIKILSGILTPDSGYVTVDGRTLWNSGTKMPLTKQTGLYRQPEAPLNNSGAYFLFFRIFGSVGYLNRNLIFACYP